MNGYHCYILGRKKTMTAHRFGNAQYASCTDCRYVDGAVFWRNLVKTIAGETNPHAGGLYVGAGLD